MFRLAVLILIFSVAAGCGAADTLPTPDIPATVDAALKAALPASTPPVTPDIEATIEARLQAIVAARPTATAAPIPTATPTPTPQPTNTVSPTPTATPNPTATLNPTATPMPTSTPRPTPRPSPTPSIRQVIERVREAVIRIETPSGTGSGTIINSDGIILTNYHVVEGYDTVTVIIGNTQTVAGTVVGYDDGLDLAVVTLPGGPWPYLSISTDRPSVGDEIITIGYPLGLVGESTVTKGLVSAFRPESRFTWIQTDAAINPGNSGGTAITSDGRFIGVPTAKITEGENIGFLVGLFSVTSDLARLMEVRSSYRLFINGVVAAPRHLSWDVSAGSITLSQASMDDGTFELNTNLMLLATVPQGYQVIWDGVDSQDGKFASVKLNADRFVTLEIRLLPTPVPTPTATPIPPLERYTNFANDYSIDMPQGWTVDQSRGSDDVSIWSADQSALLQITRFVRGYSLNQLAEFKSENVTSDPRYVLGSLTRSTINLSSGLHGIRLSYSIYAEGGYCESDIEIIILFLGTEAYLINGSVCQYATAVHLVDLRTTYNSFRSR